MTNETRTMEQIYRKRYSVDLLSTNPLYLVEAIGYLRALLQFMPYESWVKTEIKALKETIKLLLKEDII